MFWSDYINNVESFVISVMGDNVIRFPTFKYLADYLEKHKDLKK
jgi:hypothetical protein